MVCKKCLVELDESMDRCPLCGAPVNDSGILEHRPERIASQLQSYPEDVEKHLLQRILWQVTATLLLSGIVATIIIDVARHDVITWSLYPVTLCLMVLSYASLFAFWQTKTIHRILAGWVLSTLLLMVINAYTDPSDWPLRLGIPLVFAINFVTLALLAVFRITKRKGLNLLAYTFVAVAVLCISINGIISWYFTGAFGLGWSIIVAACILPVAAALIFVFLRTWNNPRLQKIFHT